MSDSKAHWESVYRSKSAQSVSWFQPHAQTSLAIIDELGIANSAAVLDVGGGASTLVDDLLARGFGELSVADLAVSALAQSQQRLGERAQEVAWLTGDITQMQLPPRSVDLWHDRAVFHFLTDAQQRRAYVTQLRKTVRPNGVVIVATFAKQGPAQCSGLPVCRYSADELHAELNPDVKLMQDEKFEWLGSKQEAHVTPSGATQHFIYGYWRKR